MKTISVGLLLPSSSVVPMAKEFDRGVKRAMQDLPGWEVRFIPEFIGQGSRKSVVEAIDRLVDYHEADVITGIVSNAVAVMMTDSVHKKPVLISNIGEHVPDMKRFNSNMFLHSSHIWREIWALNHWGVKQFGKKGMFVAGLYDTGYSFMQMMKLGMEATKEAIELPFSVAMIPEGGRVADPKMVFDHITEFNPDFIFSAFCGTEAGAFLEEFVRRGVRKPLLGLPYLLESFTGNGEPLEIFTTISSPSPLGIGTKVEKNPDHYGNLGYEAGRIIAKAIQQAEGKNIHEAIRVLTAQAGQQSGDEIPQQGAADGSHVYLVKNTHPGNKELIESTIVEELVSIDMGDPALVATLSERSSNWENPYPGV